MKSENFILTLGLGWYEYLHVQYGALVSGFSDHHSHVHRLPSTSRAHPVPSRCTGNTWRRSCHVGMYDGNKSGRFYLREPRRGRGTAGSFFCTLLTVDCIEFDKRKRTDVNNFEARDIRAGPSLSFTLLSSIRIMRFWSLICTNGPTTATERR